METVEWYTPKWIFDGLGLMFDLDPCAAPDKALVPAKTYYSPPINGLLEPWHGLVWCNPPYGRQTGSWIEKCADHGQAIALVFTRTSTKWFKKVAPTLSCVCFISKRMRFIDGRTGELGGSAGADSMLLGWGGVAANAMRESGLGACFRGFDGH